MSRLSSTRRARAVAMAASEASSCPMKRGELLVAWIFGLACVLATLSGLPV
ncbi:MAG: hypothetical protein U1E62_11695 [Alsobacter sp.]